MLAPSLDRRADHHGPVPADSAGGGGGGTLTSDPILALVAGSPFSWADPAARRTPIFLTYSFSESLPWYDDPSERSGFRALTAEQRASAREAMTHISTHTGLTLVEVPDRLGGDIRIAFHAIDGKGQIGGYAYLPSAFNGETTLLGGDIFLDTADVAKSDAMRPGSLGYALLLHELGHALGLKHPFDGAFRLEPSLDHSLNTVMSYNWFVMPTSLGPFDITALQLLYGDDAAERADGVLQAWSKTSHFLATSADHHGNEIIGVNQHDVIWARGGDDFVLARGGGDVIWPGSGIDVIDGGTGVDVVRYEGPAAAFSVRRVPGEGTYVVDLRPGMPEGIDALLHVELIAFTDGVQLAEPALPLSKRFDGALYLALNPDVARAVAKGIFAGPLDHFEQFGLREGRGTFLLLDDAYYLAENPDVAGAVGAGAISTSRLHFALAGRAEGRSPTPLFDPDWYLARNPDVARAVDKGTMTAFDHYLRWGWQEGRDPSPWFDTSAYLDRHPTVAAAGINPLAHYILIGSVQGLTAPIADGTWV